ncbi:MAG: hypothetical protein WD066_15430, partial [Planctomycetaceae bacterium]
MRGSALSPGWLATCALLAVALIAGVASHEPRLRADEADQPAPVAEEAAAEEIATAEDDEGNADDQPAQPAPNPLGRLIRNLIVGGDSRPSNTEKSPEFGRGVYAIRDSVDARAPQNPEHTKRLRQARDLVEAGDWETAERTLRYLLDQPEAAVVRDEQGRWVGLHVEASRLLRRFPPERLEAYRRMHSATAEGALREARRDGSAVKLGEVVRRYFHTDAGYAAANELGTRHLDRGEFGIATHWFARLIEAEAPLTRAPSWRMKAAYALRRAGNAEEAERLIEPLVRPDAGEAIELGGAQVDPAAWLANAAVPAETASPVVDDWRMLHGNASRTAVAFGGDPLLLPRWTQSLTKNQSLLDKIESLHLDLADAGQSGVPSMLPVLVDGKLIFRTLAGARVVDAATGRMLWEARGAWSPEELLSGPVAQQLTQMGMISSDRYSGGQQHPLTRMLL